MEDRIMLMLDRKNGQKVKIGDNIEVIVIKCTAGKVKLGFVAPKEVIINRAEVDEKIKK